MASLISFSGIASGIDSTALISSILDQQRAGRVNPLKQQVTTFTETNSAFGELSDLLIKLKDSADQFRTIAGTALAKTTTSSADSKITAVANGLAANGSYAITIDAVASNNTLSFDKSFGSTTEAIAPSIAGSAADRTVTVKTGQGANQETVEIVIDGSTTAQDFVEQFNAGSDKAEASLVNVGTTAAPSYKIAIISNNTGLSLGETSVTLGASFPADSFGASTEHEATDAEITIAGIGTVTRSANSIADVIAGVTFNVNATGSATITVGNDPTSSSRKVQEFVDAYNDVVKYINEHDTITQSRDERGEETNIFGPLAGSSLDESVVTSLRSAFSAAGLSGQLVNVLADLGVTTNRDGSLAFDSNKFTTAVSNDSGSSRSILQNIGDQLSSVDGTVAQFTRFNGLLDQSKLANQAQIDRITSRISDINAGLEQQEDALRSRFSRLEALIGKLNQHSSSLASLIRG